MPVMLAKTTPERSSSTSEASLDSSGVGVRAERVGLETQDGGAKESE